MKITTTTTTTHRVTVPMNDDITEARMYTTTLEAAALELGISEYEMDYVGESQHDGRITYTWSVRS